MYIYLTIHTIYIIPSNFIAGVRKMEDTEWIDIDMDVIGDENVYTTSGRHKLVEDEELTASEEAFMEGYEEAME